MSERQQSFRARLRDGEMLIGPILSLYSPEVAEILSRAGADWLFVDAEHGAFDPHQALPMLQAAAPCPCLIRVPGHDDAWIKKALDIGAAGVIVPQVNTAEQARRVVAAAKYPPDGFRGIGLGRAHGYGREFRSYIDNANETTAVVIQAEHRDAIANMEEIAAVPGVDAVLIGPSDLSASYGRLGNLEDGEVSDAVGRVESACRAAGVRLGIFGVDAAAVRPFMQRGYNLIAAGMDSLFLAGAVRDTLAAVRG